MINIRQATVGDIPSITTIHQLAFPDFFLTTLGASFLRLYYKSVLMHPKGVLLVCNNENGMIGFCAGTLLSTGFNTNLIKSKLLEFVLEGVKIAFSRPLALWHLYKNMTKGEGCMGDKGVYAELMSIGVDPQIQRTGAGKALLQALEEEVKEKGVKELSLTTDYYNNEKAIGFYHSLGYEEWYAFSTYPNRRMYRMIKKLK